MINKTVRRSILKHKGLMSAVFMLFVFAMMLLTVAVYTFTNMETNYKEFV